nr:hypothetical protein [Pseudomonas syringae pv. actinidiae]
MHNPFSVLRNPLPALIQLRPLAQGEQGVFLLVPFSAPDRMR